MSYTERHGRLLHDSSACLLEQFVAAKVSEVGSLPTHSSGASGNASSPTTITARTSSGEVVSWQLRILLSSNSGG